MSRAEQSCHLLLHAASALVLIGASFGFVSSSTAAVKELNAQKLNATETPGINGHSAHTGSYVTGGNVTHGFLWMP